MKVENPRSPEPRRQRTVTRIIKRALWGAAVMLALAVAGAGLLWLRSAPQPLPAGSESARRLEPGPYQVATVGYTWVDTSRPTAASGDFDGLPERRLPTTLWYPVGAFGAHPLVVYSHGFLSSRRGGAFAAEQLASHGYVVVAADFPLTTPRAPGAPDPLDVVNQPGDVSFLIDQVLALNGAERPFEGVIDHDRLGVFGLSLGGVTSTLVAFHPEWRDPRVGAAVSLAGPADVLGEGFYDHADVPFLMIGGTADRIIDFENNALPVVERAATGALLTLHGGTHIGFDDVASGLIRIFGDPDAFVCRGVAVAGDSAPDPSVNIFSGLFGTVEQGLVEPREFTPACAKTFEGVMRGGRQHMLTVLAVHAFFESHFALDAGRRAAHERFLTKTLPSEIDEVSYSPSRRVSGERIADSPVSEG